MRVERQGIKGRFGQNDVFVHLRRLRVQDAAMRAGKVKVIRRFPINDEPGEAFAQAAVVGKDRDDDAAVKGFGSIGAKQADLLQGRDRRFRQDFLQRPVAVADLERLQRFGVGDMSPPEIVEASAILSAQGPVIVLDHVEDLPGFLRREPRGFFFLLRGRLFSQ